MTQPSFLASREGHLTIVTLNRPERLNALHGPANFELHEFFDEFENDPEQWVCILTGAGRGFCAGNDLKYQAEVGTTIPVPTSGQAGLSHRTSLTKPVIAAVNGVALGGGFELALSCDLIIAAESAYFGLPEPKVGLLAHGGGAQRLPLEIGFKRAMGILLTGRHVSAREGYELGFVTEVVPDEKLMEAARAWAAQILECSPLSVRATKQLARENADKGFVINAAKSLPAVKDLYASWDVTEGPRAFAEKRKPQWRGK